MARTTSICEALRSFHERLAEEGIDPAAIGILMPREDFTRWRDEVRKESHHEIMETWAAFCYGGFTFLDSASFVYAKKDRVH
jgi:hypothetical protein